jgi:mercuric ion transport protein
VRVQLLSFPGCPGARQGRELLCRVLAGLGLPPDFEEVDVGASDCEEQLRRWGSPTILVNGRDIAGQTAGEGAACRVYAGPQGLSGVPQEALVREALVHAAGAPQGGGVR